MLNELYAAGTASSVGRIFQQEWHKNLSPLPKGHAFKISLSVEELCIKDISMLSSDKSAALRKYEEANGFSFPGFNLPPHLPIMKEKFEYGYLMRYAPDKAASANNLERTKRTRYISNAFKESFCTAHLAEYLDCKYALCDVEGVALYRGKVIDKIDKCIKSAASSLWKKIVKAGEIGSNPNYSNLNSVAEKLAADAFFDDCYKYLSSEINSYDRWELFAPLVVLTKPLGGSIPGLSVFLDLYDYSAEYKPVAHEDTIKWINGALLKADSADVPKSDSYAGDAGNLCEKDAYGNPMRGSDAKMPSVGVGPLGDVILRSMVKEIPCQCRYGTADYDSFPMGDASRRVAKLALEALSQPLFKGKTWGVLGDKELLFAYPLSLTRDFDEDVDRGDTIGFDLFPMADTLMGDTSASDEADFTTLASQVVKTLEGYNKRLSMIEITVFALKKMDKARTKVSYFTNFSAEYFYRCAELWNAGCRNLPDSLMNIKIWGGAKGEIEYWTRRAVFPKEIYECLNKIWSKDGSHSGSSKRVKTTDGLELLLRNDKPFIMGLLSVLISNSAPLFAITGENAHRGLSVIGRDEKDKIVNPAILALLLYKLGCKKEDYMDSDVFKLGRLLALADSLQYQYCKYVRTDEKDRVRKVNAPQQLVGNAMLSAAETRPRHVVGMLGARIRPYLTWAKTDNNVEAGLSRWLKKEIEIVSSELDLAQLPEYLGPVERSALYLGYMAGSGGKKKTGGDEEKEWEEKQNG